MVFGATSISKPAEMPSCVNVWAQRWWAAHLKVSRSSTRRLSPGLHFMCLNANIGRQFEFVQSAWIAGTKFAGLAGEGDPLMGHRHPGLDATRTDNFSIPQPHGAARRLTELPSFVT